MKNYIYLLFYRLVFLIGKAHTVTVPRDSIFLNDYSIVENNNKIVCYLNGITVEFSGGMREFNKRFFESFCWPNDAINEDKARVILSFVIEKNGTLANVTVLKTPLESIVEEAKRALLSFTKWKLSLLDGKNVQSNFTLPLTIFSK